VEMFALYLQLPRLYKIVHVCKNRGV
jgi:hypothetical protein